MCSFFQNEKSTNDISAPRINSFLPLFKFNFTKICDIEITIGDFLMSKTYFNKLKISQTDIQKKTM
jgi:hypothetical protein